MTATLQESDYTRVGITTDDYGPISIHDLKAIDDLEEQAAKASAVLRAIAARVNIARSTRDIGGLILIQPYQTVQRPYDDEMEKIDAALEAGRIVPATAHKRRDAAKQKRREGMVGVQLKPIDVYRDVIGVSRGLFVRMQHREASIPTAAAYLDEVTHADPRATMVIDIALAAADAYLAEVAQAEADESEDMPIVENEAAVIAELVEHGDRELAAVAAVAAFKREECKNYDQIAEDVRVLRDEVALMLLNGNPKVNRPPMSNADFARLSKLTTARVAHLRYGTR